MRRSRLRVLGFALAGAMLVFGAACTDDNGNDDDSGDETSTPTPTSTSSDAPTPIPTEIVTETPGGATGGAAGGDAIEPANPDEPPVGVLESSSGDVELGLGTYCWSPPTGSGNMGMCADMIGVITSPADLTVTAGETLSISGEPGTLPWPPMTIGEARLWPAPSEPIESQPDSRAWDPDGDHMTLSTEVTIGEHFITLPEDLEPGHYVLSLFYTAGPDRGSDASYGAILVVE